MIYEPGYSKSIYRNASILLGGCLIRIFVEMMLCKGGGRLGGFNEPLMAVECPVVPGIDRGVGPKQDTVLYLTFVLEDVLHLILLLSTHRGTYVPTESTRL